MMAGRGGQTSISGEQRSIEGFRERDVHGVNSREVVSQIPDPRPKQIVLVSVQRKVGEVSLAGNGVPAFLLKPRLQPHAADLPS